MTRDRVGSISEVRRLAAAVDGLATRLDSVASPPPERFDYFDFEERFRGPCAEIKRRQAMYVDVFRGRKHVVDLGCGRGEFVELLAQQQVGVMGVDSTADMIAFCESRGLTVVHADIFDYLYALADASLDGIAAIQVVEHLAPWRILDLLSLAAGKLLPGSPIVVETINPACPVAMGNFFVDPTHIRPVPAPLLAYLYKQAGLSVQTLRFSAPVSQTEAPAVLDVDEIRNNATDRYQDYAVIGQR